VTDALYWVIRGEDGAYLVDTSCPDRFGFMRSRTTTTRRSEALQFISRAAADRVMTSQPTGGVVKCMPKATLALGPAPKGEP